MAKAKKADEELAQLKLALSYLAEQWQEQSGLQAQTLLSLLARIESLAPGSPEKLIKAAVHDAKLDAYALDSQPASSEDSQEAWRDWQEAWKDWQKLKEQAGSYGLAELAEQLQPPEGAGRSKLDKAMAKLRKAFQKLEEQVLLQHSAGLSDLEIATNLSLSLRQVLAILWPGAEFEDEQQPAGGEP